MTVTNADDRLAGLAERLVDSALRDYRDLEALDRESAPNDPRDFDRQTAVLLRELYGQWADHAESLLERVRDLGRGGRVIDGAAALADAVGRTRAMLSVTLEDLDRAEEQLRRGEGKTAEEVRRELRLGSRP